MPTSQRNNIVEFPANTPVPITLKYPTARLFSNDRGERAMYSLTDGRTMFLDPEVARQIEESGVKAKEPFTLTRKQNGAREKSTWEIARNGQQPDGTFIVPRDPEAGPTPKPMARAASLVDEANQLVDAYAVVLERTLTTYQGKIKPDEARALLITAYIQRSKLSTVA